MAYRVWWKDEFVEMDEAERDDRAWTVPPERGIFNPEYIHECDDVEDAAKKYAEYFLNQRDGHENTWPLDFVVHDGRDFHVVSVELDYEPCFHSSDPEPYKP